MFRLLASFPVVVCALGCALFGGGKFESEACTWYLDCVAATDPEALGALQEAYGADGSCGESDDDAARCEAACEVGLLDQFASHPDVEACSVDGLGIVLSAEAYLGAESSWELSTDMDDGDCNNWGWWSPDVRVLADSDDDFTLVLDSIYFDTTFEVDCSLQDPVQFACPRRSGSGGRYEFSITVDDGRFAGDYEVATAMIEMTIDDCAGTWRADLERQ